MTGFALQYHGAVNDSFFVEAPVAFCQVYPLATYAALSTTDQRMNLTAPVFATGTVANASNSVLLFSCTLQLWILLQEQIVGPQGLQGPAGSDGADGATGPQGPRGLQGLPGALPVITQSGANCMLVTGQGSQILCNGTSVTLMNVQVNGTAYIGPANDLLSTAPLTNGQVVLGVTGGAPVPGAITGTAHQVIVTTGPGSLTLALPQNVDASSSPTFTLLFLSGLTANGVVTTNGTSALQSTALTNGQLLIGSTGVGAVAATLTGTTNQVNIANAAGSITLSLPQNVHSGASPTFVALTLSGLTASGVVTTSSGSVLQSTALINGQLLIGSTGSGAVAGTLTGTTNQVNIANGAGTITVSLPQNIHSGASPTFVGLTLSGLTASGVVTTTSGSVLQATALTNGQLLIGNTGNSASAATLTGTMNQVNVANAAGSITLSLPQSINSGASPTFAGLTLSGLTASGIVTTSSSSVLQATALTNGQLLIGNTGSGPTAATLTGTTNQVNVATGSGSITLSLPQSIDSGSSPTFTGLTVSGLTAKGVVTTSSSSVLQATALTNGQLLIGSTGNSATAATLTGTTNQVNVATGSGSITLSTPQNIHTGATPTFASETLTASTNQLTLGTTQTITVNAVAPSASRTYSTYDTGNNCNFNMGLFRYINANSNLTLQVSDSGTTVFLGSAGPGTASQVTLPALTFGATFKIFTTGSGSYQWIIQPSTCGGCIDGVVIQGGTATTVSGKNTIRFAGATTSVGDWLEFTCINNNAWHVFGAAINSGAYVLT
jgi:hypothetical protein